MDEPNLDLVAQGSPPEDAIRKVRSACLGYIQSDVQEHFVAEFAEMFLLTPEGDRGLSDSEVEHQAKPSV